MTDPAMATDHNKKPRPKAAQCKAHGCGNWFLVKQTPGRNNRKFCSVKCRDVTWLSVRKKRICECGVTFYSRESVTVCKACRDLYS